MTTSEIMLATTYDPDKVVFPAEVSIKLDGVASDFYKTPNGWIVQSRQGKPLPSAGFIIEKMNSDPYLAEFPVNAHIDGELTVMGVPVFKDAGGIIRRKVADKRVVLNVYDLWHPDRPNQYYNSRVDGMEQLVKAVRKHSMQQDGGLVWPTIVRVPVLETVLNAAEVEQYFVSVLKKMQANPVVEGLIIRTLTGVNSLLKINKRSKGMMRFKPKPTVDLQVLRFEEATANKTIEFLGRIFHKNEGLGAVGRIVCEYNGEEIGVGPGALTHKERRLLWEGYVRYQEKHGAEASLPPTTIAEVEHMLDMHYKALRQAVFKRWRTDKTTPSEES